MGGWGSGFLFKKPEHMMAGQFIFSNPKISHGKHIRKWPKILQAERKKNERKNVKSWY